MQVHPGGIVEVVAPERAKPADVAGFVAEARPWIEKTRRSLEGEPVIDRQLPGEVRLRATGRTVEVHYGADTGRRKIIQREDCLTLGVPRSHRRVCQSRLRTWLQAEGRRVLIPWLDRLSLDTGISYNRVQVRGQRSRWGSCSESGTISLNFCLLFLAPESVRYLIIHELCHRRHFNHSARFWRLVERFEPDYRRIDRQLADAWREVPGWVFA